ncbi:DNA-binding protein [Spiractinospora alimapuensis]|uniref:DNA-binding protein n=1 Tax=Spiractinospora alimapuensis TaxID=2820884 RepID=UPI001F35D8EF|nr:DNA-binding protein [Spiractinospora alimapuensis]QVQ52756.1 DNA-binding protein [Spiractinospora alimapuensis]
MTDGSEEFTVPDAHQARVRREYSAITRIGERHGATEAMRHRGDNPDMLAPYEAVRLVSDIASGSLTLEAEEAEVDVTDVAAALTLLPRMRADMDAIEESLLLIARGHGMTWRDIAHGLGLGSAQAARQRYERVSGRSAQQTG